MAAIWRLKQNRERKFSGLDLLEEMRAAEACPQESSSTVLLVVKAARGKDDLPFPTNVDFDDWLNHFELVCANISNGLRSRDASNWPCSCKETQLYGRHSTDTSCRLSIAGALTKPSFWPHVVDSI